MTWLKGNVSSNISEEDAQLSATFLSEIVKYGLIIAVTLSASMAVASRYNAHPDEHLHIKAGLYYMKHWLPPEIGTIETFNTYSKYGYSYLNNMGLEYFFMGKFAAIFSPLVANEGIALRLFNVMLSTCLFLLLIFRSKSDPNHSILFIPMLCTPQVWYLFSYANNDALGFFCMMIIVSEIMHPRTPFKNFIRGNKWFGLFRGGIIPGIFGGVALLSKTNYLIFLPYALFVVLISEFDFTHNYPKRFSVHILSNIKKRKQVFFKLLFMAAISFSIVGIRQSIDFFINGSNREEKIMMVKEILAEPEFKLSTMKHAPNKYFGGLRLREKGVTLFDMLLKYYWTKSSFNSFVGVYGWMTIKAHALYYWLMNNLYIIFLMFLSIIALFGKERKVKIVYLLSVIMGFCTIFISMYHSWVNDFQPQGRYLFPVLGITGVYLYCAKNVKRFIIFPFLVIVLFLFSIYSFLFVGLFNIPK